MRKKRTYSIDHFLKMFSLFVLMIAVLVVIAIGIVSQNKMREQVAETNKTALTIMVNEIDRDLGGADQQLYDIFYSDDVLSQLRDNSNAEEKYSSEREITNSLNQIISQHEMINGCWFYLPENNDFIVSTSGISNMDESDIILESLSVKIQSYQQGEPVDSSRWTLNEINGDYYLMRLIDLGQTYCGAWVRIDVLQQSLLATDENTLLVFSSMDGKVMNESQQFANNFTLPEGNYEYITSSDGIEYTHVSLESQTGDYWVSYLSQNNALQIDMDVFAVALIAVIAIFLLMVSTYIMQRMIYRPLIKLKNVMSEVQHGNLSPAIESSRLLEFQLLNQTFEYMLKEIKNLRIDVYEQQLTQQKIKRQYLQIQLKSHFYLNCLNIIYSLSQVKNYSLIQDLTRSLGAYFRYTSEDSSELHVLENELEHVRNYMHIQEIRFPNKFVYYEEVHPSLLGVRIPSLVLQTFIENSIEHAIDLDKDNWVRLIITPEEIEQTQGMNIVIKDNGKGFSMEKLEGFKNKDSNSLVLESKNEIGIKNVKNRLELIYKGKARINFFNDRNGGAVVNIWLPVDQE